jgi:hypothetical protein
MRGSAWFLSAAQATRSAIVAKGESDGLACGSTEAEWLVHSPRAIAGRGASGERFSAGKFEYE